MCGVCVGWVGVGGRLPPMAPCGARCRALRPTHSAGRPTEGPRPTPRFIGGGGSVSNSASAVRLCCCVLHTFDGLTPLLAAASCCVDATHHQVRTMFRVGGAGGWPLTGEEFEVVVGPRGVTPKMLWGGSTPSGGSAVLALFGSKGSRNATAKNADSTPLGASAAAGGVGAAGAAGGGRRLRPRTAPHLACAAGTCTVRTCNGCE